MTPSRWNPMLLVDPKLARHPTLVGERLAGSYEIIAMPRPRRWRPMSAGTWLFLCAASAGAVLVTAGLLGS